jgi:hypothetical protein
MTSSIDRRRFLQQAGVAAGATGAIWAAPSIIGSSTAFAIGSNPALCPPTGGELIDWSQFAQGTLSGANAQSIPVQLAAGGSAGYNVTMTVTPVNGPLNGGSGGWISNQVRNGPFNGSTGRFYGLSMYGNTTNRRGNPNGGANGSFGYDITFSWPAGHTANGLTFSIGDIDNSTSSAYQDRVWVDTAPIQPVAKAAAIQGSGTSAAPWYSNGGNQTDSTTGGNVTLTYPTTLALSSLTISYRNNPSYTGDEQHIGILNLAWCQ